MLPRSIVLSILSMATFLSPAAHAAAGAIPYLGAERAPDSRASSWVPKDAAIAITVRDGRGLVQGLREFYGSRPDIRQMVDEAFASNPQLTQARVGLLGLAAGARLDPWDAIGSLLGDDLTISLTPREGEDPALLAVSQLGDAESADRFISTLRRVAGLEVNGEPDESRSFEHGDSRVYMVGDGLFHARAGGWLIVANDRALIVGALDAGRGSRESLAKDPHFQASMEAIPEDAVAGVFVSPAFMAAAAPAAGLMDMIPNPLAGLLFGGWHHGIRNTESAVAWIGVDGNDLSLNVRAETPGPLPNTHRGFQPSSADAPRFAARELPGYVGEFRVHRDWAALFAERESLLTVTAAGQLVEFSNTMTALTGGLDFIDQMLAKIDGPVRLLAAEQSFEGRPVAPAISLPAFALVAPIDVDEQMGFGPRMNSAALSALSIINIERSQNNQTPLLIQTALVDGTQVVYGSFTPMGMQGAEGEARLGGIEHNFQPAVCVVNDRLVIATSLELTEQIAGRLGDAGAGETEAGPDAVTLNGRAITRLLGQNRAELVANRMVEEDLPKAQAERDIDLFLDLLSLIDSGAVDARIDGRTYHASVTLSLRDGNAGADEE